MKKIIAILVVLFTLAGVGVATAATTHATGNQEKKHARHHGKMHHHRHHKHVHHAK